MTDAIFLDGFSSVGGTRYELNRRTEIVALDGTFRTDTHQAGPGVTGTRSLGGADLSYAMSLDWSRSSIRSARYGAPAWVERSAYNLGLIDTSLLMLEFSPELHVPLVEDDAEAEVPVGVFRAVPTFDCDRASALDVEQHCRAGVEIGVDDYDPRDRQSGIGASLRLERRGGRTRFSASLSGEIRF